MKEQIKTEDIKKLNRDSVIFSAMYYALRLEKQKKEHNIQTYKEILAFTEGKMLDEIAS